MPQRLTETKPTCPKCAELEPIEIDEREHVRVEKAQTKAQVYEALGGRWPTSDFTHAIRPGGLKLHYGTRPEKLQCSFEGGSHPLHSEGYVVQTACGELLNVGIDCGHRWIPGMATIERLVLRTLRYDSNMRTIKNDPMELQTALAAVERRILGLKNARTALVDSLRLVSKRMREACDTPRLRTITTLGPYVETVARTREGTENVRRERLETTHEIRGWELWGDVPSVLTLEARLTELRDDIAHASEADPKLEDDHERLAKPLRKLHDALRETEEWAEHAASFFGEENLRQVLVDTKQDRVGVQVDGRSLVFTEDGRHVRIDANGRTVLD